MTRMPEHGATVQLRDQTGSAHRSEVLQIQSGPPGTLLLRSPADRAVDRPFDPGTRLLVSWPEENSYWVLPVVLVELRATDGEPVLVAEVDDDAWREERREYARSALDAAVAIDFATTDEQGRPGPSGIAAELIDLSEVALRSIVTPEFRDWFQAHIPVVVRLKLSGDAFDLPGQVLLAKPAAREDLGIEIVILFDRPVARVEQLRAHITS